VHKRRTSQTAQQTPTPPNAMAALARLVLSKNVLHGLKVSVW
jgi:hypothetical protein